MAITRSISQNWFLLGNSTLAFCTFHDQIFVTFDEPFNLALSIQILSFISCLLLHLALFLWALTAWFFGASREIPSETVIPRIYFGTMSTCCTQNVCCIRPFERHAFKMEPPSVCAPHACCFTVYDFLLSCWAYHRF